MAKILSKSTIVSLNIVRPWHVSQSIDAFAGLDAYDITLSGSMVVTGSFFVNGLTNPSKTNVITYCKCHGKGNMLVLPTGILGLGGAYFCIARPCHPDQFDVLV